MRLIAATLKGFLAIDQVHYIAIRYASVGLVALEALVFARLLGPGGYGSYALVQQIALLLALTAIGHPAGYVYSHFRIRGAQLDQFYPGCAFVQYLLGVGVALVASLWNPLFLAGAAYYFVQIPYLILEPVLRVRGQYALSGSARGFGAAGSLIFGLLTILSGTGTLIPPDLAIGVMLAGTTAGYLSFYIVVVRFGELPFDPRRLLTVTASAANWRLFWSDVLRPGIPLNASSALLTAQNNAPRFFLEHFHSLATLGVFSLSWQLSQGAMVMLSSMNAVSAVEIGKLMEAEPGKVGDELRRQFCRTARVGLVAFVLMVLGSFVLSRTLYRDYQDLVLITVLLNCGYLALNITGSVTGYLFYERRTAILNGGYALALFLSIAASWAIGRAGLWFGYQVIAISVILVVLNATFLLTIARMVRRIPPVKSSQSSESEPKSEPVFAR